MRGGSIEKADHMRTQERLCDATAGKSIRRNHRIRTCGDQVLFRVFLAGASDNLELWIESARGKDDVEVCSIGGSCGYQASRILDLSLSESLFLGGVANQHEPLVAVALGFGVALLDDHEGNRLAGKFAGCASSDATGAADDVVTGKAADFALHFSPAEETTQFEF